MDFSVATDIALCRNCNIQYKYSDLSNVVDPLRMSKHDAPRYVTIYYTGSGEEIIYRKKSPVLLFLMPFYFLWSGGSMTMIYVVPIINGTLTMGGALFGIPFALGTIVLTLVIACLLFCSTKVILNGDNSMVIYGIGKIGYRTNFDIAKVESIRMKDGGVSINDIPQKGIALVENNGTELIFGSLIEEGSKEYIAKYLASKIDLAR